MRRTRGRVEGKRASPANPQAGGCGGGVAGCDYATIERQVGPTRPRVGWKASDRRDAPTKHVGVPCELCNCSPPGSEFPDCEPLKR